MASPRRAVEHRAYHAVPRFDTEKIRRPLTKLRTASASLLTLTLLLVLWIALATLLARGEVLPGIRVGGAPVAGMGGSDGEAAVTRHAAGFTEQPVTLLIDGRTVSALPAELGLTVDDARSVEAAMAHGRDGHLLEGVLRAARLSAAPVDLPLVLAFDATTYNAYLDALEAERARAPVDAAVTVDAGTAVLHPARDGVAIDRAALATTIKEGATELRPMTIEVPLIVQEPAITTGEAEAVRAIVNRLLAEPLTFSANGFSRSLTTEEMAGLIAVAEDPEAPGALTVLLVDETAAAIVDEVAADLDRETHDAWVQDLGTHSWLVPAQAGQEVDRAALRELMGRAVARGEPAVTVPMAPGMEPRVTTEALMRELGITEVISVGDSVYAGSGSGRAHNVEQAAFMIDGTLVAPGGVFSFNDAVGSLFNGEYLDAGSYLDGPNGQSLAGGVCQVSTTVFRAALDAGFPIEEWWPHSYRSPFYELGGWSPGFDASIVQDLNNPELSTDFTFRNTTESWLLIRATVSADGELRVEIHGAPTGYAVSYGEPVVEVVERATDEVTVAVDPELPAGTVQPDQPAMDGLRVTVVRYVHDADGNEVSLDTFVTTYKSYGAIRRVSADMEGSAAAHD